MCPVGGYATDGGMGMKTIVHIGAVMDDTGPTEQMDTVGKQHNEENPLGKEFEQG